MSSKGRKIAKHIGKSLRKKFDLDALSENDDLQQVGKPIPWNLKNFHLGKTFQSVIAHSYMICYNINFGV